MAFLELHGGLVVSRFAIQTQVVTFVWSSTPISGKTEDLSQFDPGC